MKQLLQIKKEKKSGCTVHFVDVDIIGKILLQRKVDVSNNETPELTKKVLKKTSVINRSY